MRTQEVVEERVTENMINMLERKSRDRRRSKYIKKKINKNRNRARFFLKSKYIHVKIQRKIIGPHSNG